MNQFGLFLIACTALVTAEPPSNQYGVPHGTLSGGYGTPNNGYGGPTNSYGAPTNSYGAPANNYPANNVYNAPSNNDYTGDHHGGHHGEDHSNNEPKSYEFGYKVKDDYTGTNYHQKESSDGNQVRGEYRVALPDGRTQIVTYWADWQSGFHADVRYEGEAQYPETFGNSGGAGQYGAPAIGGSSGYNYPNPNNQYGPPH